MSDPPAPPREALRWRPALLIGWAALALVVVALLVSESGEEALPSEDGLFEISSARVALSVAGEPPGGPVQLPYQWDAHHPGERGSAVFSATFDVAAAPGEPWALLIPKIGNRYEIRLNATLIERGGDHSSYDGADYALLPRYVPLGPELAQGTNRLTIAVRADRGRDAGLSRILVGPAARIRDAHERMYGWIVARTAAISALSLGVGLLSLGLWRSRSAAAGELRNGDATLYLYAAVAELTEAVVAGVSLLGSPPISWPWWGVAWNTLLGASICLVTLTCVEIARWGRSPHARHFRRWLGALVLAGPAMAYAALGSAQTWALVAWYAAIGVSAVGFGGLFVARALRGAALEHQLAALAIAANLVAGVHDFHALRSASDYPHVTMLMYSSILFELALGAIVILRFRSANQQVRELMQTLSARVSDRERALGESYRRLELLARQQERLKERASILRDMHDGVGAHLSMALRQIESGHLSRQELVPPIRDALDQLKLTIDNVNLPAGDVASLMGNLRYRLGPRIESSGIHLEWRVDPLTPVDRLDGQAMRDLMFILFEAISNVLQHSGATEMHVEAVETERGIEVRVADNGVGFDAASSWERGLLTMRNRAERIGAHLEIRSAPGDTRIEILIPRSDGRSTTGTAAG